jgi:alpha-L-rhamnosidase
VRIRFKACGLALSGFLSVAAASSAGGAPEPDAADPLAREFLQPPSSAAPRVWWHWLNGNITKQGVQLDLAWMKRIGIGGFHNFDASLGTPQVVDQRLAFMTPPWKDAFAYTVTLAGQLGLEMAIAGSPGWSETGGPWVAPADGMKKVVWSETQVPGGKRFRGVLPKPPSITGPFQSKRAEFLNFGGGEQKPPPEFYADSAVIAYRIPAHAVYPSALQAALTASAGTPDLAAIGRADSAGVVSLPMAASIGRRSSRMSLRNSHSRLKYFTRPMRRCCPRGCWVRCVSCRGDEHDPVYQFADFRRQRRAAICRRSIGRR